MTFAGVAVRPFTIPTGTPLAGFAARTTATRSAGNTLSARALAVCTDSDNTLLVVADLTSLSPDQASTIRARIAAQTGIAISDISVLVTHTHAAPNVDRWLVAPLADAAVIRHVEDAIVTAGIDAWQAREPARLGHAAGQSAIARNRRRASGPVDSSLDVVRVDAADGSPLVVLFSYACHPTVIGPDHTEVSPDWPGAARRRVEEGFPGATAVFLQGFCGDCNVGHSAHSSMSAGPATGRTPLDAERVGSAIGAQVVDLGLGIRTDAVPVFNFESRIDWRWSPPAPPPTMGTPSGKTSEHDATVETMRQSWAHRMEGRASDVTETLSVHCFVWGETVVVQISGEPFAQLAIDLRRLLPHLQVMAVGYANGVPGYAPYPAHEYDLGGYEVAEAHYYYGRPGPVPAWFGDLVVAVIKAAAEDPLRLARR